MKIALLLPGQLRWMDNPHTVQTHHDFIINKYDTDVFGSFWIPDDSGVILDSRHVNYEPSPSDSLACDKIQKQYNFKKIEFIQPKQFSQVEEFYTRVKKHNWPNLWEPGWIDRPNVFNNIFSQMYAIQCVTRLLDNFILRNSTTYDMIVLSRPDLCIWSYPELDKLDKNRFYLSNHHGLFPDLTFIYGPSFIKVFSEVFDNLLHINDDELYSLWEPNAEGIKFNSYRRNFSLEHLSPIPIPVRIVRGQDCRGPQW